jgi:hypothetical protein
MLVHRKTRLPSITWFLLRQQCVVDSYNFVYYKGTIKAKLAKLRAELLEPSTQGPKVLFKSFFLISFTNKNSIKRAKVLKY